MFDTDHVHKEEWEMVVTEIEKILKKADAYIAVGKALLATGQPAITDVLRTMVKLRTDICSDLEPELAADSVVATRALYRDYKNYQNAGFTKAQAFALVLARVKPASFGEAIQNISKSVSDEVKSRRK